MLEWRSPDLVYTLDLPHHFLTRRGSPIPKARQYRARRMMRLLEFTSQEGSATPRANVLTPSGLPNSSQFLRIFSSVKLESQSRVAIDFTPCRPWQSPQTLSRPVPGLQSWPCQDGTYDWASCRHFWFRPQWRSIGRLTRTLKEKCYRRNVQNLKRVVLLEINLGFPCTVHGPCKYGPEGQKNGHPGRKVNRVKNTHLTLTLS